MKVFTNKKKMRGYREFLYILPFIIPVSYTHLTLPTKA